MEAETKKISFGFNKSSKKTPLLQKAVSKRTDIQLIDCVESHTIKVKGVVEKINEPLVIPMPSSENGIQARLKEAKIKREALRRDNVDERPDSELTADELAARELLREVQNKQGEESKSSLVLPAITENVTEIEGKEEPTMEDYESIPISDYGLAMLRGMGWKETTGIGKIPGKNDLTKKEAPALRPKGMGLGADKGINKDKTSKPIVDEAGQELVLKKACYAKIIDGKQKGLYCQVEGFDEDGRVIIKTTLQGSVLSLNEFCVKPVTKEEYFKLSKVLNNAKYEAFKAKEEGNSRDRKPSEDKHRHRKRSRSSHRRERSRSRSRSRGRNKSGRKEKRRHKHRNSSSGSDSDHKSKRSKEKCSKHKHQEKYR